MVFSTLSLCSLVLVGFVIYVSHGQPLVPGLFIFGDSVVDVGNNNQLYTLVKANFPPYGRDFVTHVPTGRFCNGKLATDFTAENLGFTTYPPAYLSSEANGNNLLIGANFASGASGYYENTAALYHAIPLSQQLKYYQEYQRKLVKIVGQSKASSTISGSIYVISAGSSDFVQNYYINPYLYRNYTPDQFSNFLVHAFYAFIQVCTTSPYSETHYIIYYTHQTFVAEQKLYGLGARRIGVTSLPPLGCLPATVTLFGGGSNQCVSRINQDALSFNNKLSAATKVLLNKLPGLKLVVFDIYKPLYDMVVTPNNSGFMEARKACCGTGTFETSLLCNARSLGTCSNATGYVFWDGFHPSEAANKVLADALLVQGIDLIG